MIDGTHLMLIPKATALFERYEGIEQAAVRAFAESCEKAQAALLGFAGAYSDYIVREELEGLRDA